MNNVVFLDNLQQDPNNKNRFNNKPKQAYGSVSIKCKTDLGYYCKLNTGIYLFRYGSYEESSPYGWKDFHKIITSKTTTSQKEFNKLETFNVECRYLIAIHISNLRPLFTDKNFTKELNRGDSKIFADFVSEFENKYNNLFKQFKFETQLEKMYSELEDFGTTV